MKKVVIVCLTVLFCFAFEISGAQQTKVVWKKKDGKWSLYTKDGTKLTTREYERKSDWEWTEGLSLVGVDGKFGFIDKTGKEVIPLIYENSLLRFTDGIIGVRKDGKWGYIDREGKVVIPIEYDDCSASGFQQDRCWVKRGDKTGFVDRKGQEIIPCIYDGAGNFQSVGWAFVVNNGKCGYIDSLGNVKVPLRYDHIGDWSGERWQEGVTWVNIGGERNTANNSVSGGLFGLVDTTGTEIVPVIYKTYKEARENRNRKVFVHYNLTEVIPDTVWKY